MVKVGEIHRGGIAQYNTRRRKGRFGGRCSPWRPHYGCASLVALPKTEATVIANQLDSHLSVCGGVECYTTTPRAAGYAARWGDFASFFVGQEAARSAIPAGRPICGTSIERT